VDKVSEGSMTEHGSARNIEAWLQGLGLERYGAAFRENEIDWEVLPKLTSEDLREIGVAAIGHRRKLLDAIATLSPVDPPAPIAPAVAPRAEAERRQVTVMFCDLIGSTALSSRLDPEELSAVIRGYQARVAAIIARFGGFIARYVGDGILIYFGWPKAHEANAETAVRAALAVVDAIAQAPVLTEQLQVRLGIATGLVVVGEPIDTDEGRQQTAIGETPNLAARLQDLAGPNGIVIDAATHQQIGGLFEFRDRGPIALKGLPNPVPAWEVLEEAAVGSRFEALRAAELTPLVGRQEELDVLLRRWRQARDGQGRVVLISGEPGIGKSRLLAELDDQLAPERYTRLRFFCSPHSTQTPLHPVIRQIEFDAGFTRDDQMADRERKLRARLEAVEVTADDIALITALLHLPGTGLPALNLSPQRRKERTFAALLRRVERISSRRPALILIEDMQWADPSTRELLDDLIRRLSELPVLLVLTYRPDFVAPWVGHAGVTLITLSRLERGEAAMLARQLALTSVLSATLLEQIVRQSDGVPLFIEELTKAVLEAAPQSTSETLQVAVPETLQASLLARLDRMPAARQVAQIGSVFGRRFPRSTLGQIADLPDAVLDGGLDQLAAAGLLFRRGEGPEATYIFKHALVQDAAYESLLRTRRAALHSAIGAVLEGDGETAASRPALVGHHFAQAGEADKASHYFLRAGVQFAAASAMAEAEAHLTRGLVLADDIAISAERIRRKAELTLALGNVRMAVQGTGSPEHRATFAEAAELCRTLDPREAASARLLARTLFGQWSYELQAGNLARALEIGEELYAAGRDSRDPELRAAVGGHAVGYMFLGRLEDAMAAFGRAVADADIRASSVDGMEFGFDPICHLYAQYARTLALRGFPGQARKHLQFALRRARELQHLPTTAVCLMIGCTTSWNLRDHTSLSEWSRTLVRTASEQGYGFWYARGLSYAGWIRAAQGAPAEGLTMLDEALREFGTMHIALSAPHTHAMRADVHVRMGRPDLAKVDVENALAICARTGEVWPEAELHRRSGELQRVDPAASEACFQRALAIARSQGTKLFELRTAVSLARLWSEQSKRAEARELLAPTYEWFTEGFNLRDLKEAKALFDDLQ
jgi:class 3 adenylate cyclase/tetratricopeptide (TPR) repeat protein